MELNVLIVDDEPIVCKGLRETVPWDKWGVRIAGEAHDGEEALEALARQDVDLILSDIRMPGMDGLELSRVISERFPAKRIVMLSGYDEFEYARQALRLGVRDYLLKPVDIDELMLVIRKIRHELAEERAEKWRTAACQLLSALAVGEKAVFNHPDLALAPGMSYRVMAGIFEGPTSASPSAGEQERDGGIGRWTGKVEEMLNTGGNLAAVVSIGPNRLLALCAMNGRSDDRTVFRWMTETVRRQSGFRMWCCLSSSFRGLDGIREHYREAVKGLPAFPVMEDAVYEAADIPEPEWLSIPEEAGPFRPLIELGCDRDTLRNRVDGLFDRFRERRYGLDNAAAFLRQLEEMLCTGLPSPQALRFADGRDVSLCLSYDELKALFIRDLEPLVIREGTSAGVEQRMLVDKALRYMKDHYNKDLRATMVASRIGVSPNYFSQLLKKVTGKHFNDLLHEIRIDKAKQLLAETDYRIFQVGRLVGYKEYKYFVQMFKKLTAVSPTRYRMMAYQAERTEPAGKQGDWE